MTARKATEHLVIPMFVVLMAATYLLRYSRLKLTEHFATFLVPEK